MKKKALEFLKNEVYCIIATVSAEGSPQAAFVAFSENQDLEIMIGTSNKSRKYQNIMRNPNVAIEFGIDGKRTMQYEGVARILNDAERKERAKAHFVKQPSARKYESDPDQVYFVVRPTWLRISTSGPVVLGEMREFK